MESPSIAHLAPWQISFVDGFVTQKHSKSLLVAAAGTGKTMTALVEAEKMLATNAIDSVMVISDRVVIRDQWSHVAASRGLKLTSSLENHLSSQGVSTTIQALSNADDAAPVEAALRAKRWLVIVDEPHRTITSATHLVDKILSFNAGSKALFISRHTPAGLTFDAVFSFGSELIFQRSTLNSPDTQIQVARFSPSFALLRKLQSNAIAIDDISWRDFEKLVATLLEKDGYVVELMQGSKDGGVDVIAVKDLGPSGYFKALWQAKKKSVRNKVGISVVRELADTRQEFGASKGIVVTSSYLTRGALERINRDKFILGKLDRDDIDLWIRRLLFNEREPF